MTANVTFCVLPEHASPSVERLACLFAEQCLQAEVPLRIHVADADQAAGLDKLLWTFKDTSFIPHGYADRLQDEPELPVTIAWPGHDQPAGSGVLFNLAGLEPAQHEGYARVIEIVPGSPAARGASRERYRKYRDLGCALERVESTPAVDGAWIQEALGLQ